MSQAHKIVSNKERKRRINDRSNFFHGSLAWARYLQFMRESRVLRIVGFAKSLEVGKQYSALQIANRDSISLRSARRRFQELQDLGITGKVELDNKCVGRSFRYFLK